MLTPHENKFKTWDGTELFYRSWLPEGPFDKALILFHRGHEHSDRLSHLAELLAIPHMAVFAWDARGNGRSPGPRDFAEHFADYERDADAFLHHLCKVHSMSQENVVALGHSVGAALVASWVHDFAPRLRGMILATPAFRIRLYIPLAIPFLRFAYRLGWMKIVPSYVKSAVLTHDREERKRLDSDPLITHSISTNILLDLHDTSTRLIQDAAAIRTPTLLLSAGKDWVVSVSAQDAFFDQLGSHVKEKEHYPQMLHAIFHDTGRQHVIERSRRFIEELFREPSPIKSLVEADKAGFTKQEYEELKRPLPLTSVKGTLFKISRLSMQTLGRLSEGIRLGWDSGFNSGRTLDYVYENNARGITPFGKWIDWFYLNSIGWKGIRVRRELLEGLLRQAVEKVHSERGKVHMVDIASGAGRYMLDVLGSLREFDITAVLRDQEVKNLEKGRMIALSLNLSNVQFIQGNAFDRDDLSRLSPKPEIAVVSGLYELFPDNGLIQNSLAGLAQAVPPGGYLVYTNQPWHPQVEMIARTLCDWDGRPWIMRRRTQAEMDDLVMEAGFTKESMSIDPWGIFTVSIARRNG